MCASWGGGGGVWGEKGVKKRGPVFLEAEQDGCQGLVEVFWWVLLGCGELFTAHIRMGHIPLIFLGKGTRGKKRGDACLPGDDCFDFFGVLAVSCDIFIDTGFVMT